MLCKIKFIFEFEEDVVVNVSGKFWMKLKVGLVNIIVVKIFIED